MYNCNFCGRDVDPESTETYREVKSWVNGPKLDSPILREQTGLFACKPCIKKLQAGQAPDQEPLL